MSRGCRCRELWTAPRWHFWRAWKSFSTVHSLFGCPLSCPSRSPLRSISSPISHEEWSYLPRIVLFLLPTSSSMFSAAPARSSWKYLVASIKPSFASLNIFLESLPRSARGVMKTVARRPSIVNRALSKVNWCPGGNAVPVS
jgi:hypothetical protein